MTDISEIHEDYLESLRASLTYGRCAGKVTELTKLHNNRLVSPFVQGRQLTRLMDDLSVILIAGNSTDFGGRHYRNPAQQSIKKIQNLLDDEALHPYFDFFAYQELDSENQQYVAPPEDVSSGKNEQKLIAFRNKYSNELRETINLQTIESIHMAAVDLKKRINSEIQQLDFEMNRKLNKKIEQLMQDHKTTSERIEAAEIELRNYQDFIKDLPVEFSERDMDVFTRKGDELELRVKHHKSILRSISNHLEHSKVESASFRKRFLNQLRPPVQKFIDWMDSGANQFSSDLQWVVDSATTGDASIFRELKEFEKGGLVSVFGDPGFGKTIQLRQFTHRLISEQLELEQYDKIPIFVKAKSLAKVIQSIPEKKKVSVQNVPFNPFAKDAAKQREMLRTSRLRGDFENLDYIKNAMFESEPDLDEDIVASLFSSTRLRWKNIYLIIDAYDEILNQSDRAALVAFFKKRIETQECKVVITCRNSHKSELLSFLNHGESSVRNVMMDIHFTQHELREEMPTKLANAWGINSDQLAHSAMIQFGEYEAVLTHPLFVGFFCMLLLHDIDEDSKTTLQTMAKSKSRIVLKGPISLQHVVFLRKVIEFGLSIIIKERRNVSKTEEERIKQVFYLIASTYLTTGLSNMNHILAFIYKYHNIKLTEKEISILNENLGVVFVNGEKEIEWTHKTLPEVATGLLIKDNQEHNEFLTKNFGSVFGTQGSLWSECLLMTVIQDDLEKYSKNQPLEGLKKLFPIMGSVALGRTLQMFGVKDVHYFANIKKNTEHRYEFYPAGDHGSNPLMLALGEAYFDSMRSGKQFPIPNSLLGELRTQFLVDIFYRTNLQNEPYADFVFEPWKVSLPDLPISDIFTRFEDNVEKLTYFYLIRKAMTGERVHPSPEKEKQFVEKLVEEIRKQATTFVFNFFEDENWIAMLLESLSSKEGTDLLSVVCFYMRNNFSNLDLEDVDSKSLQVINNTILKSIRSREGSYQNHRKKLTAVYLKQHHPEILRQLIGCILTFGVRMKGLEEKSKLNIPEEFNQQFAEIRRSWGLPDNRYPDLSLAFEHPLGEGVAKAIGIGELGNIKNIPNWIPISEFIQSNSQFNRKFFKEFHK